MNSLIKLLIYVALLTGVFSLLAVFSMTTFGQNTTTLFNWFFTALLPFQKLINLPAFLSFLTNLMLFETAYWTYVLLNKILMMYTGNNLHGKEPRARN